MQLMQGRRASGGCLTGALLAATAVLACTVLSAHPVGATTASVCSVADFGGVGDNRTDNSQAFRRAITGLCKQPHEP
jgi:hypothetical protein